MFGWLSNLWGRKPAPGSAVTLDKQTRTQASYDVAQTTSNNERHWANADGLSPRLANSTEVRKIVRERARYEILENNCYAKGIVLTLANDTIGTGPRLQVRTDDSDVNNQIEKRFKEWCACVGMADKLHSMRVAKAVDGETFAHFTTNDRLLHAVKLDFLVSEADHFSSPIDKAFDARIDDGIEYDEAGNPIGYYRRKSHPGGDFSFIDPLSSERLPADQVIHLYRCDRPGQLRGMSEFVTALSIFAQLRSWTQSELDAARFAASQNAVMRTTASAISEPDDVEALDAIPFERNGALTLPKGWDITQLKSEHPGPQSESFERRRVREIARCVNMSLIIALGDSTDANYASGRLDHQVYFRSIGVERAYWVRACLDRIFMAWLKEAVLIPGYLPDMVNIDDQQVLIREVARNSVLPPHEWFWDGFDHVDPMKEAAADQISLTMHTTTLAQLYGAQGKDWEAELRQRAKEIKLMDELDLLVDLRPEEFNNPADMQQPEEGDGEPPPRKAKASNRPGLESALLSEKIDDLAAEVRQVRAAKPTQPLAVHVAPPQVAVKLEAKKTAVQRDVYRDNRGLVTKVVETITRGDIESADTVVRELAAEEAA